MIEVEFERTGRVFDRSRPGTVPTPLAEPATLDWQQRKATLRRFFTPALGFDDIVRINVLDGVRVYFRNGDVAPSGRRATRLNCASMPTVIRKRVPTKSLTLRCANPTESCAKWNERSRKVR